MKENYLDSRIKAERKKDNKIKSITTISPMPKEIKEKCNHNAVAKGNGEKNWSCVDCGKSVKSPKEKEIKEKIIEIIKNWFYPSEQADQILQLLAQEKQKLVEEITKAIEENSDLLGWQKRGLMEELKNKNLI